MQVTSWKSFFEKNTHRNRINESALEVVTLTSSDEHTNEVATQKLNYNQDICCSFFYQLKDKIALIHYFSKLSGSIHDLSEKFVGLFRFDNLALSKSLQPDIMERRLTFPEPNHATTKDTSTV